MKSTAEPFGEKSAQEKEAPSREKQKKKGKTEKRTTLKMSCVKNMKEGG